MSSYIAVGRQIGLQTEMNVISHNVANISTTGFRREGIVFSEYINAAEDPRDAVSLASGRAKTTDYTTGALTQTDAEFDVALEGPGFFMVATPDGERLTRGGQFQRDAQGNLVNPDGFQVLDVGGAPVFVPTDGPAFISEDGTISVNGLAVAQLGVFEPADPNQMQREKGVLFISDAGVQAVENPRMFQGFVENSNVNPVLQIARMIEVQRAYEIGQKFQDMASERRSKVIDTLTR